MRFVDLPLSARRVRRLGNPERRRRSPARRRDVRDVDAEQQRQRVRGDVVRPLRRAARILVQIGVVLPLEQRLGERAVRLRREHDVAAGRIASSRRRSSARWTRGSRPGRAAASRHAAERLRVGLRFRNHDRRRPLVAAPRAAACRARDRPASRSPRARRARFIARRRGTAPSSPRSGSARCRRTSTARRATPTGSSTPVLARCSRAGAELVERNVDRRREPRARRLGEDADAAVVVRVLPRRRPRVVRRVVRDAGEALGRHAPASSTCPAPFVAGGEDRVDVRLDRDPCTAE